MRKLITVILLTILCVTGQRAVAQSKPMPFFDKNGTIALQTTAVNALADTIAVVNHRWDDVVWSRVVYRIIDLRDKQNYQLYFPVVPNEEYKSLFRIILESVVSDTLKAYGKADRDIVPVYSRALGKDSIRSLFKMANASLDSTNTTPEVNSLVEIDPITQQPKISSYLYKTFAENQYKFLVQEIVFFDKHMSRMYTKIVGIAPLFGKTETNVSLGKLQDVWNYFQSSVLCWFLFDELRPYLARHYVIPNGNETQRLTFDEFFAQKLYSSYLLGESNMNNRMILQYLTDPDKIRKEQNRIDTEILNFEQDLWEY